MFTHGFHNAPDIFQVGAKLFIIIFILTNRFVEMDCYASLPEP